MTGKRLLIWLPLLFVLLLAAAFAIALNRPDSAPATAEPALLDQPLPQFNTAGDETADFLTGLAHDDITPGPSGLALVNFYASWCAPCRIEHPYLLRLARDGQVAVYGIAYRDKVADTAGYLEEFGNPFAMTGLDPKGEAALAFGITGVPETFVIDADGRIRFRIQGPISATQFDTLQEVFERLQAAGAS